MASQSDFGPQTTAEEVAVAFADSIRDKAILITGSPALLILTGRDPNKVNTILKELAISFPKVKTRPLIFDLAPFDSINTAAAGVRGYPEGNIDIIINNAGCMNIPTRTLSKEGIEMQLAVNYLGPWLFTNSIMEKILASKAPIITNVSSNGYALSLFRFADYNFDEEKSQTLPEEQQPSESECEAFGLPWGLEYLPPIAYGQSKTAMILYTRQLAAFKHLHIVSTCSNPGAIDTDLWRHVPAEAHKYILVMLSMKSVSQGSATTLVAALDPKLADINGAYLEDCQVKDVLGWASDEGQARELWALSEKLTGKKFDYSVSH